MFFFFQFSVPWTSYCYEIFLLLWTIFQIFNILFKRYIFSSKFSFAMKNNSWTLFLAIIFCPWSFLFFSTEPILLQLVEPICRNNFWQIFYFIKNIWKVQKHLQALETIIRAYFNHKTSNFLISMRSWLKNSLKTNYFFLFSFIESINRLIKTD